MSMSVRLQANSVVETKALLVGYRCAATMIHAINTTASAAYLQIFDAATAAAVTVGTTVPTIVVTLAASASADVHVPDGGIIFENGIVVAGTTTATGNTGAAVHARVWII